MFRRWSTGLGRRGGLARGPNRSALASQSARHSDFADIDSSPLSSSSSTAAVAQHVVGVVRNSNRRKDGDEFSRLGTKLDNPRRGVPLPRETSRALTLVDVNRRLQETAADEADSGDRSGRNPSANTPLPYDDEAFAETILEMEVEGALDEAWQDAKKAHVEDVREIVAVLKQMKVRDIVAVDTSQKTSSFDYLIVGTCDGSRHIHLASWAVSEADKNQRVSKIRRQKTDHQWEVVPIGRIVVNLMLEPYRNDVTIDRKWVVTKSMDPLSAAQAPVSEGRHAKSHGLWTLTLNLQDLEDFEVDYCKDVLLSQR